MPTIPGMSQNNDQQQTADSASGGPGVAEHRLLSARRAYREASEAHEHARSRLLAAHREFLRLQTPVIG